MILIINTFLASAINKEPITHFHYLAIDLRVSVSIQSRHEPQVCHTVYPNAIISQQPTTARLAGVQLTKMLHLINA